MRTIYCSATLVGDRRKGWQEVIAEIYAHLDIEISTRAIAPEPAIPRLIPATLATGAGTLSCPGEYVFQSW